MKNIKLVIGMLLLCLLTLSGCGTYESLEATDVIIEINEETFVDQVEHILLNPHEYFGKKIRLEGIYETAKFYIALMETDGEIYHTLIPANGVPIATDRIVDSVVFQVVFRDLTIEPGGQYLGNDFPYGSEDERAGLGVFWEGELPDNGSWVEAIGIFERVVVKIGEIPTERNRLNLISLTVLDERGLETVIR